VKELGIWFYVLPTSMLSTLRYYTDPLVTAFGGAESCGD
jgi:hypothetical protein